jgi:flavin-dependent thymidylate synthase
MITDHAYKGELRPGASCQFVYSKDCARQAMEHQEVQDDTPSEESFPIPPALSTRGLRGRATSPEAEALENWKNTGEPEAPGDRFLNQALVRAADAAQYARPAIPAEQRGQIRVRLLNATPDPLGSVAALIEQYKGNVIRSLSEVTDEQRRAALADMGKTVLSGPLEAVQFHWQIEGVTRSITHQMVRSRASFFAQESLRFAIPEGNWADEIPLPPSISGVKIPEGREKDPLGEWYPLTEQEQALREWRKGMRSAQVAYSRLIELGVPAEEARGVLPHDMPTRIHWVCDLRTLLTEAGKRTCTQAQFPWRMIFAGMASALRTYPNQMDDRQRDATDWQFVEIANALRPVCFQTGRCGFMAQFDRSCKIRGRVDAFAAAGVPSSEWGTEKAYGVDGIELKPIADYEWAADPSAARS